MSAALRIAPFIGWRTALAAALLLAAAAGPGAPWREARAADQNWQAVIVYGPAQEPDPAPPATAAPQLQPFPQAPLVPNPAAKPVLMRPGQNSIPPWPQPLPQDARELQLLNGSQKPVRVPNLVTGAGPEAPAAAQRASTQPVPVPRKKGEPPTEEAPAGQQYCFNVADAAADARFAWQQRTLLEIEQELEKRVALLEKRTEEYRVWLARREEFVAKAQEGLLKIYQRMRPDAAALQIAAMDDETGAAIMSKLDARAASAIMAEMDPAQAARLSGTIAGAARVNETREQAAANARALQGEAKR
jgi:flagellar motility protein MotE (MotC chaperone)